MQDHLTLLNGFIGILVFQMIGAILASMVADALKQEWNCWPFGVAAGLLTIVALLFKGQFMGCLGGFLAVLFVIFRAGALDQSLAYHRAQRNSRRPG